MIFNKNNLGLKRPGTGIPPKYFEKILGKCATRNIRKGCLLKKRDFE